MRKSLRTRIYGPPLLVGLALLGLLGSWAGREYVRVRAQGLEDLRASARAVMKALEGSLRASVRRGRFQRERFEAILDSVTDATGIRFVVVALRGEVIASAGAVPADLPPLVAGAVERFAGGTFAYAADVRLQDCPPHLRMGRGPGWGRGVEGLDQDLGQEGQRLVIGLGTEAYERHLALARNQLAATLGGGAPAVGLTLAVWIISLRNRALAADLAGARSRVAHLAEMGLAAAGLAHETKNPLGIIRGLAQRLHGDASLPAASRGAAESIIEEVDTTTARLGDFLAYARLPRPRLHDQDPGAIIAHVASLLRPDFEAAKVRLTVACDPGAILADADMLRQVLVNLLLNSLEASPEGAEVAVRLERRAGEARLVVADRGRGVPPEVLPDLFKPYVSGRAEGHGIGLAIVRRIIEEHGWTIELSSSAAGTTFTVAGIAARPRELAP